MRICFVADMNSIHSRKFISYFPAHGHEVQVISTTPFRGDAYGGAEDSGTRGTLAEGAGGQEPRLQGEFFRGARVLNLPGRERPQGRVERRLRRAAIASAAPLPNLQLRCIRAGIARELDRERDARLRFYEKNRERVAEWVREFHPDLLQCLRLPVEGYLGACAQHPRTLHFCWGNDLTLYSSLYPAFGALTRDALRGAAGFLTDCHRDERLAFGWGLPRRTPTLVVPGSGGLELHEYDAHPMPGSDGAQARGESAATAADAHSRAVHARPHEASVTRERTVFLTLRGLGGRYTDNLPVVRAIPRLRELIGDDFALRFAGSFEPYGPLLLAEARKILAPRSRRGRKRDGDAERFFEFVGRVPHDRVEEMIRASDFVFSATYHDGTPNSMLETMAYGGIPLCGDLESIREWIDDGVNGYLFDMKDPNQIAATFARAVSERGRQAAFRERNRKLIAERADYSVCMAQVEQFYERVAGR